MRFVDRSEAGEALGSAVAELGPADPLVMALPRGGVPVAAEVARTLDCDLDVLVVRKLGVPHHPELAMGALGEGGVIVRNDEVISMASIGPADFDRVVEREEGELQRRVTEYRQGKSPADPRGRTAIIVDDGLATGSTARAAVTVLRGRSPSSIWVAVPVAPGDTIRLLEEEADRVVVVHQPRFFGAVGAWYDDFSQTTDAEVRELLSG